MPVLQVRVFNSSLAYLYFKCYVIFFQSNNNLHFLYLILIQKHLILHERMLTWCRENEKSYLIKHEEKHLIYLRLGGSCCCLITKGVWLFAFPWTVAHHAPLSMGFSRQEYWSELLFPSLGDLPNPRIELKSPELAGEFFTAKPPV